MSYGLQYRAEFSNEINQNVLVLFARKDTAALPDPIPFEVTGLELNDDTEDDVIIAREAVITINADDDTPITWETFLADAYDEWWVIIYLDLNAVFEGFLTPEEGNSPFLDKPYDVVLRATNGLKLLQNVDLSDLNGNSFKGKFTLIQYISAALQKTLLNSISSSTGIPLRIYSNVFESSMIKRSTDITQDFYQQTKLDHRTFRKDATTFKSCYDVLFIILNRHSRLFYWNARWVIEWVGEHQWAPGGRFYTEYNADGTVVQGVEDIEEYATVGKQALIYPIDEAQIINSKFANKLARTDFKFRVWPEIPLNNKFERGTLINSGPQADIYDQDKDGNVSENVGTFKRFTIDDWTYGANTGPSSNTNLPLLGLTASIAARRSIYNIYGIELIRELQLAVTGDAFAGERWLQSEGIPVRFGDKIKITFSFRTETDMGQASINMARVYIKGPGTNKVSLRWDASLEFGQWVTTNGGTAQRAIVGNYDAAENTAEYRYYSVESNTIPINGTLYIVLGSSVNGQTTYYTGFDFEYIPYVAGGYVPVEGDYVQHSQGTNQRDNDIAETFMSDSAIQVVSGAMEKNNGQLTNPDWARGNLIESHHFKGLANLARFNLKYRRMKFIEGPFTSLDYEPSNNQLIKQPISYHKNYRFEDMASPRDFMLIPPLRMDIVSATTQAEFVEVSNPDNIETPTSIPVTISLVKKMIVEAVNRTTTSEWDSAGLAPAISTPNFPPQAAEIFTTAIVIVTNPAAIVTVSASPGTGSNSPTFVKDSENIVDGKRITIAVVGASVAMGNIFTVTIFGHNVVIPIVADPRPVDGSREGIYKFDYIFGNGG